MAHLKITLPREGTVRLAGGESLTESSDSVCPTVSGGGKDCHEALSLVPLVVLERVEIGRSRSPLKGENARETRAQRRLREMRGSPVSSGSNGRDLVRQEPEQITPVILSDTATVEMVASRASSAASGGAFFERPSMGMQTPMYLSDSGSSTTTTDVTKFLRTRKRNRGSDGGSTSDTPKPQRKAVKGKGAAGGLTEAQQQLNTAKRDALQSDLEEKMTDKERQNRMARAKSGYGVSGINLEDRTMPELVQLAGEHMEDVAEIASKCSNMKGTLQKALKDRAAAMLGVVAEFASRTANEETTRLQATVDRLQAKCDTMERRVAELLACRDRPAASTDANGAEPSPPEAAPSCWESTLRKMLQEERAFTRACFAGIEDRLLPEKRLRPPLAADAKRSAAASANGAKTTGPSQPPPKTAPLRTSRATRAAPSTAQADADASLPSTTPANEWSTVIRRGKARRTRAATPAARAPAPPAPGSASKKKAPKKSSAPPGPAKKATAAKKQRLISPKTAAVVVTLTAEAADKGETYATVFKRARAVISPSALGLEKVRCRQTQTGARMFEFPGAQGGSNADTFAEKLREAMADSAKVVRPTKCSSLLVTELDDSVTRDEVLAAVAEIGGCAAAAIKAGQVRPGRGGMGTIRLQCPVNAAKAVVAKGRVLVGFSAGVVRVLEEQPMRCFKCFGIGHTRPRCPSSADRADSCYRCGEAGHKAASCSAKKAHCAVCAEAGRPSGHLMSGRRCMPPPKKGKEKAKARPKSPAAQGGAMSE